METPTQPIRALLCGLTACLFAGCSTPSINLATNEPIKVDIDVRLDVYQHSETGVKKTTPSPTGKPAPGDPESNRRNRMADIQQFKNSRIVGEGQNGLLSIRETMEGEYGTYIKKTVAIENTDRMDLMTQLAEQQKTSLENIQQQQGKSWYQRSFKGELVEVVNPDGTSKWIPKEG